MGLPENDNERKIIQICTGVLDYFPDAIAEVAIVSRIGNEQHNPGQPLHWAKEKSTDEANSLVRHLLERGKRDKKDGQRHSAKVAWRALALLQREIETEREQDQKEKDPQKNWCPECFAYVTKFHPPSPHRPEFEAALKRAREHYGTGGGPITIYHEGSDGTKTLDTTADRLRWRNHVAGADPDCATCNRTGRIEPGSVHPQFVYDGASPRVLSQKTTYAAEAKEKKGGN